MGSNQMHQLTQSLLWQWVTPENEYFIGDNTALIEGRGANGEQFYDKRNIQMLPRKGFRPGQWNSVTFTVEPTTELPVRSRVVSMNSVYLEEQISKSGNFGRCMPELIKLSLDSLNGQ